MVWKPHLTVAALIEKDKEFLLVEENTLDGRVFNQPAGHLEEGEDLITAVKREVNEETAWTFEPEYIIAIQLWRKKPNSPSFLRVSFAGNVHSFNANQQLDSDIIATHWHSYEEIKKNKCRLRSPLVLKTVNAHLKGSAYPLSILHSYIDL